MPDGTLEQASDSPAVIAAIEQAQRLAGRSDKEFVRALLRQIHGAGPTRRSLPGARGTIPIVPAAAAVRSFRIFEDPRYLANARALALRSGARTRVIGGAGVPPAWVERGITVRRLPTPYGIVNFTFRTEGPNAVRLRLAGELAVPTDGIVVVSPLARKANDITETER